MFADRNHSHVLTHRSGVAPGNRRWGSFVVARSASYELAKT